MNIELKPLQVLVLWKMLFMGEENVSVSKLKPKLDPKLRKEMEAAGLIEIQKHGRSKFMVLTDKAWDWAAEHLDAEVSLSQQAGPVLQAVLTKLMNYMQRRRISLAEIFAAQRELVTPSLTPTVGELTPVPVLDISNLEERIRSAYLQITGGQTRVRVHLYQLRQQLSDIPRSDLDGTLKHMMIAEQLILYPLDDPQEITPLDEAAALIIAGRKNHIVIFEG